MEDENFNNWLMDNEQIVKEIIPVHPGFIADYLSEIEGSINSEANLDMMYWELGQSRKFEIMQPAAKYSWVESRIEKLRKLYKKSKRN